MCQFKCFHVYPLIVIKSRLCRNLDSIPFPAIYICTLNAILLKFRRKKEKGIGMNLICVYTVQTENAEVFMLRFMKTFEIQSEFLSKKRRKRNREEAVIFIPFIVCVTMKRI